MMKDSRENELKSAKEWVEIFPYGLTIGIKSQEPLFLFKDKSEKLVLPLHMEDYDAALAIHCLRKNSTKETSMEFPKQLLDFCELKVRRVLINECKGHHQYMQAEILYQKEKHLHRIRADQGLALCLRSECQFFTTYGHVKKIREVQSSVEKNIKSRLGVDQSHINDPNYLN